MLSRSRGTCEPPTYDPMNFRYYFLKIVKFCNSKKVNKLLCGLTQPSMRMRRPWTNVFKYDLCGIAMRRKDAIWIDSPALGPRSGRQNPLNDSVGLFWYSSGRAGTDDSHPHRCCVDTSKVIMILDFTLKFAESLEWARLSCETQNWIIFIRFVHLAGGNRQGKYDTFAIWKFPIPTWTKCVSTICSQMPNGGRSHFACLIYAQKNK